MTFQPTLIGGVMRALHLRDIIKRTSKMNDTYAEAGRARIERFIQMYGGQQTLVHAKEYLELCDRTGRPVSKHMKELIAHALDCTRGHNVDMPLWEELQKKVEKLKEIAQETGVPIIVSEQKPRPLEIANVDDDYYWRSLAEMTKPCPSK